MLAEVPSETGMYCRGCYYDLRGQETPRCPECGRAFDPADPHSFLEYPGRFHGLWIKLNEYRGPAAALLTCAWLLCMVLGSLRLDARRSLQFRTGPRASVKILSMITFQRMLWQREDPRIVHFDRAAAVRDLPPQMSPYTQQARMEWRRRLADIPIYAVPTAAYALLLIPLVRRRLRWLALGVSAFCCALVLVSCKIFEISDALLPNRAPLKPSHAYLDEYVYIDGVQFTSMEDNTNTTIAAYDIRSFEGNGLRIVAFANGHVRSLGDDEAKPLFEAQDLVYPKATNGGIGE